MLRRAKYMAERAYRPNITLLDSLAATLSLALIPVDVYTAVKQAKKTVESAEGFAVLMSTQGSNVRSFSSITPYFLVPVGRSHVHPGIQCEFFLSCIISLAIIPVVAHTAVKQEEKTESFEKMPFETSCKETNYLFWHWRLFFSLQVLFVTISLSLSSHKGLLFSVYARL